MKNILISSLMFLLFLSGLRAENQDQTKNDHSVEIIYKNWRGETSSRRIIPENIFFGNTSWHPEMQWFLHAYDVEKKEYRDFAIQDIASWSSKKFHPAAEKETK